MNAKRLTGKLRRLARQEVPDKPDLWPAIQARLSRQHTATARGTTHRAEVASVFTWRADARRSRFGTGALTLASALVLVLLVAGLALILGNQSGDHPAVGSGATPSPSLAAMATPSSTDPTAEAIPSTCPVTLPPPTFVPATPAPGAAGSLILLHLRHERPVDQVTGHWQLGRFAAGTGAGLCAKDLLGERERSGTYRCLI